MSNGRVSWLSDNDDPENFPPVELALTEPDGLLAAGGELSSQRLLSAYRRGIFPWYEQGQPILWWSPDPRCLFLPGDYHFAKRMRRFARNSHAEIRINSHFVDVLQACREQRRSQQGTWITAEMKQAYTELHQQGWAHSIEVWEHEQLLGGLYGIAIGRAFFGESMFSGQANASKLALLYLGHLLQIGALDLVDCQVQSGHLERLGARSIERAKFLELLEKACDSTDPIENWPDAPIKVARLAEMLPKLQG